ncbi:MAG: filamentous hemagglutinin N-terminal domain-containing protein [Nitrospira sp.]|nr:filamentous hemagglutinin N-terminal domain-containing protein [Nitrospira sp.]MDH4371188.1 filamentous hemagglutinin N-terminal domain-containing protein [Nitrospira sp.]
MRNLFAILVLSCVGPSFDAYLALAQVTTAITPTTGVGNLGTTVTSAGNTVQITGGTRPNNGANLFHSFKQFSVGSLDTAHFLNAQSLPTSNILARVTGGNPSNIFGAIDTMSYPNANLYLMNPAGIVFGPDATLNVSGSVAFTTANYLRLAETNGSSPGIFHADTSAQSLLTSASIAAFGFLSPNPEAIEIQGSKLTVRPDQSLALVGGNITIQSGMLGNSADPPPSAPGKQILIASVASPGEVLAGTLSQAPNIRGQSFGALGTVQISQNSKIDASGENGGRILVRGGRLLVDDSTISANSTKAATSDTGRRLDPSWLGIGIEIEMAQDAIIDNGSVIETSVKPGADHGSGGVRITADHITVSGGPKILAVVRSGQRPPFAGVRSNAEAESTASSSGDISLDATSIRIKEAGQIETRTASTGKAGDITLKASGDIALDLALVGSGSETPSSGHAGNITFSSSQGNVTLAKSFVTSQVIASSGNAGNIKMEATHGDVLIEDTSVFNRTQGTGTLGGIQIVANNLLLKNRSLIAENNLAKQVAGNITIMLEDRLNLAGDSAIQTGTAGPAKAADLIIKARDILITENSSLFAGTVSSGTGGAVKVTATNQVSLSNGASVTASSIGEDSGNAGNISINAGQQLELVDRSSIATTTESSLANGGNIDIRAVDRVRLANSEISTSVMGAEGSGGNIFIDPKVVILEGSNVTAQAVGGTGGNITFVTPLFLADSASVISASSQRGVSGTVTIQSPTSNLSGTVGQLASKTNPPQVLLQNRCIALAGGEQSTFILAGRDALPSEPGGWLSSPVAMEHWTGEVPEDHVSHLMVRSRGLNTQPPLVMSKDEPTVLSLRRLTPPGFLVRSFAATAPTGCSS